MVHFLAPNGPPTRVVVSMKSSFSIIVSWLPPVGGADGYVIIYSTDGASNMTQLVEGGDQTSLLLTGLSEGHLYIFRVFAYKDLPSPLSEAVHYLQFVGKKIELPQVDKIITIYSFYNDKLPVQFLVSKPS